MKGSTTPRGVSGEVCQFRGNPRIQSRLREAAGQGPGWRRPVVSRAGCERNGVDPDKFIHRSIDRYDSEILHNDRSLELLVGKLKQLGILENTLIVEVLIMAKSSENM